MSTHSTPGHRIPDFFDGYNAEFTAEISSKMHVPDKITVFEGVGKTDHLYMPPENLKSYMQVPERILIAGGDKHIAGREPLPELKLEESVFNPHSSEYVLATPPNVLTLDEYPSPQIVTNLPYQKSIVPIRKESKKASILDQSLHSIADLNESTISANCAPEEEVSILRRQVRHLSRRVLTMEQENQQRLQREIVLYSVGVIYFVVKGLTWLRRNF